jgi:hypothetical protein
MYLEAVAMLPQIYMFQKQASDEGGTVEVRILALLQTFACFASLRSYLALTIFSACFP